MNREHAGAPEDQDAARGDGVGTFVQVNFATVTPTTLTLMPVRSRANRSARWPGDPGALTAGFGSASSWTGRSMRPPFVCGVRDRGTVHRTPCFSPFPGGPPGPVQAWQSFPARAGKGVPLFSGGRATGRLLFLLRRRSSGWVMRTILNAWVRWFLTRVVCLCGPVPFDMCGAIEGDGSRSDPFVGVGCDFQISCRSVVRFSTPFPQRSPQLLQSKHPARHRAELSR
jgi:hypothetical protein